MLDDLFGFVVTCSGKTSAVSKQPADLTRRHSQLRPARRFQAAIAEVFRMRFVDEHIGPQSGLLRGAKTGRVCVDGGVLFLNL